MSFLDERQPLESSSQASGDGDFVERFEFEFRKVGVDEVHTSHELFKPMIDEREVEGSVALGFGEAAAAGNWIEVVLSGFLFDDEIQKANLFRRGYALVFRIEDVFQGRA